MRRPKILEGIDSEAFRRTLAAHYAGRGIVLPDVVLAPIKQSSLRIWKYSEGEPRSARTPNRRKVGECVIREYETSEGVERSFTGISLLQPQEGYGVAVYQAAICEALDAGRDFRTDPEGLNDNSVGMWRRLLCLGLAVEMSPLVPAGPCEDIQWHVVVPARG